MTGAGAGGLRVLVVDDERPALDELAFLLRRDERVGAILTADSAAEALRVLHEGQVELFLRRFQRNRKSRFGEHHDIHRARGQGR